MPPFKEDLDNNQKTNYETPSIDSITLKQLQDAIPPHLFKRDLLKSTLYLIYNLALVFGLYGATYYWLNNLCPDVLWWPSVLLYWWFQGIILTGIWVIAHECGHQGFSEYHLINDFIGWVLHSALLVPYFAWRVSHGMHHRLHNHMSNDLVYIPSTKSEWQEFTKTPAGRIISTVTAKRSVSVSNSNGTSNGTSNGHHKKDDDATSAVDNGQQQDHQHHENDYVYEMPLLAFLVNFVNIVGMLTIGWPRYLFENITAGKRYHGKWVTHFTTNNPLFNGKYKLEIVLSNIGLILAIGALTYLSYVTSFKTVCLYYGVPYLLVNAWQVMITYLHHTDTRVPHYREGAWNYVKGALSTVDRDYGWFINHMHHEVASRHVIHHLFPRMPHYNTKEATDKYLKPLLGKHYLYDDTFYLKALWNSWTNCIYVPDEGDVLYYKSDL